MSNPFSLKGLRIIVTGASSGIGRAIAIACSEMGATLVLTGRNESRLEETLALLEGEGHSSIVGDLTIQEDVNRIVENLPELDGVVHNAGVGKRVLCKSITESDIDYIFDANTKAPMIFQSVLLQQKKIRKNASIVFVASKAAESPLIGNAIYSASKGGIIAYSKVLALELAPRQVRVNCICPAMIWTDFIVQEGITREDLEMAQQKYPLKRYGTPEDIAYLSVYLLSSASRWMTGSCLDITGGATQI